MNLSTWAQFAANLFDECVRDGIHLNPEPSTRFCREQWLRSKALKFAEATDVADQPKN